MEIFFIAVMITAAVAMSRFYPEHNRASSSPYKAS